VQQKGTSNLRVLAGFEFVAGRISTGKNITAVKSFLYTVAKNAEAILLCK